ncbi:MAG TPA: VCBS repeat-containing protein [Gemmataceae bacterium]|nr:VCBS repeat-containing protein [Gemmataceae bacterium]
MLSIRRLLGCLSVIALGGLLCLYPNRPAQAYVEAPHSLGQVIALSSTILVMRVEQVDKTKNLIIFRKVRDLKGKHPTDIIRHNIGRGGFNPREWQYTMEWAEVGKTAIFFHNGGASETCLGTYWYQAYAGGEWWNLSHGEPFLLRSFAGNVEKLAAAVTDIVAGRETVVPCMVDGNKDDLHMRRARIQRVKAGLKLDYNPKRDFVGWGGEDFRRLQGMPGFSHYSAVARVDPDAQAISSVDINGDGKADLCLAGSGRVALLQNGGESLNEVSLPGATGCRAAVWADYNGDGKADLLLATPTGPKLYTNLGGTFRDDTYLLPHEPAYNLTSAAWLDYDGDGQPDLLLGNGFHGLRLYRNKGPVDPGTAPLRLGKWSYIGPFPYPSGQGFKLAHPPEKEINLTRKYGGKNGEEAVWREGKFTDGQINNLALFRPANNVDAVVYLHREIECASAMELPVSLGSDDSLTVWLNGQKIVSEDIARACAPDQNHVVLKLKAGKNNFLMKVGQGSSEWSFYFQTKGAIPKAAFWSFADVSDATGLGPQGLGSTVKGDTLTVCDVNGDGRPDFLYGAGSGLLALNTPKGFVEAKDSGITYRTGKTGPVFGDYDNDGRPDLFIPQANGCKLFHNDGDGHFSDITDKSGLKSLAATTTCAAWGDIDNDGQLDLIVGCLRDPNRFFRNKGDGTFTDASETIGLDQRIFNTQAVCLVDLNNDGMLDVVFNNEGQESCVLLGNPEFATKRTPVTLQVNGKVGVTGSRVNVLDKAGKLQGSCFVSGGDGRGGQAAPAARFALQPGTYRVEVLYSSGERRAKEIVVATTHLRGVLDEKTPKAE